MTRKKSYYRGKEEDKPELDPKMGTSSCPDLASSCLSFRHPSDHTKLLMAAIQHVARVALDVSLQVFLCWERKDGSVKPGSRREVAVLELKPGHHQGDRLGREVPAGSPAMLHVTLLS